MKQGKRNGVLPRTSCVASIFADVFSQELGRDRKGRLNLPKKCGEKYLPEIEENFPVGTVVS